MKIAEQLKNGNMYLAECLRGVCILGLTPTTSTTMMTVIGDALVVLLMSRIEFKVRDYAKRHHGGYLGMKSRAQNKSQSTFATSYGRHIWFEKEEGLDFF